MSFLTLNVNGLRDTNKRAGLLQWLSHLSLDFVCLQETHVVSTDECSGWFSSFGYLCLASPGSVHSRGSVILYRPRFALDKFQIDAEGRFVMADFKFLLFVLCVCMLQIGILTVMIFSRFVNHLLILLFPPCCVGTLMLCLTGLWIVVDQISLILPEKVVPLCPHSLMSVVLLMFGGFCILGNPVFLGPKVMDLLRLALILLAVHIPGFIVFSHVILCLALFQTIPLFC